MSEDQRAIFTESGESSRRDPGARSSRRPAATTEEISQGRRPHVLRLYPELPFSWGSPPLPLRDVLDTKPSTRGGQLRNLLQLRLTASEGEWIGAQNSRAGGPGRLRTQQYRPDLRFGTSRACAHLRPAHRSCACCCRVPASLFVFFAALEQRLLGRGPRELQAFRSRQPPTLLGPPPKVQSLSKATRWPRPPSKNPVAPSTHAHSTVIPTGFLAEPAPSGCSGRQPLTPALPGVEAIGRSPRVQR